MERESNIGIDVELLQVIRRHEQVRVVDPDHFALLLDLQKVQGISSVDCAIIMPQLGHQFVNVLTGRRFESVEQSAQLLLVEKQELFNLGSRQPYWIASLFLQEQCYSLFLLLCVRYDAGPADPLEVYEVFLPEFEYGRIKEALAFFDDEFARLVLDYRHWQLETHHNERVMLADLNLVVK